MENKFLNKIVYLANKIDNDKEYLDLIAEYIGEYEVVVPLHGAQLLKGQKFVIKKEGNTKVLFVSKLETKLDVLELIYTVLLYEKRDNIDDELEFYQLVECYINEQIYLFRSHKNITETEMKELLGLLGNQISDIYPGLKFIAKKIIDVKIKVDVIIEPSSYQNNFYGCFYLYLLESNTKEFEHNKNRKLHDYLRVGSLNLSVIGNEEKTLELFLEANEKYPNNPEIYSLIAECYELLGDELNTVKYFELALSIEPNNINTIKKYFSFHISHMFSFDEDTHKSSYNIILIRKFLKIFNHVIHNNLGDDECVEMFAKLNYFLFKYNKEKKEYLEIAYKYYQLAHNLDKTNVIYLEMVIEISILLGKYDEFIQYCEEIISFYPGSYMTWYYLSEFYSKLKRNVILGEFCKSVSQSITGNDIDDKLLYKAIQENDWDFVFQSYSRKREEFVYSFTN